MVNNRPNVEDMVWFRLLNPWLKDVTRTSVD